MDENVIQHIRQYSTIDLYTLNDRSMEIQATARIAKGLCDHGTNGLVVVPLQVYFRNRHTLQGARISRPSRDGPAVLVVGYHCGDGPDPTILDAGASRSSNARG